MKKRWVFSALLIMGLFCGPVYADKLPKIISMTSYAPGSAAYVFSAGLAEAITKISGMKVRIEPFGTDVGRILPLRTKDAELGCFTAGVSYYPSFGIAAFAKKEWGPQPLRLVWRGATVTVPLYVRGDSDIYKLSDLKGRKIGYAGGWPSGMRMVEAMLAFGGLTWDDVKKVPVPGYSEFMKACNEGKTDAAGTQTTSASVMELASTSHGIRWLPAPHNDTQGWARLLKIAPYYVKVIGKKGAGIDPAKPLELGGYPYGMYAYDVTDENIIYHVVKSIHQGYDIFKNMHPDLPDWNIDQCTNVDELPVICPFHPGVVKYFKEIGKWTDRHEAWQQNQLKAEKERKQSWKRPKK